MQNKALLEKNNCKSNRGGKRAGAGRKPNQEKRINFNISTNATIIDYIRNLAKEEKTNISEYCLIKILGEKQYKELLLLSSFKILSPSELKNLITIIEPCEEVVGSTFVEKHILDFVKKNGINLKEFINKYKITLNL